MKLMSSYEVKKWLSFYLLILSAILTYSVLNNSEVVSAAFSRFFGYISPFLAGAVIAYLLSIPCSKIEQLFLRSKNSFVEKRARGLAVLAVYLIFIVVLIVLVRIIFPEIISSVGELVANFPIYFDNTRLYFVNLMENDDIINKIDFEKLRESFTLSGILGMFGITSFDVTSIWKSLLGILSVSTYFFNTIIAFISSIYLLLDPKSIKFFFSKLLRTFVPPKQSEVFMKYLVKTNLYFQRYLACLIVDGAIVGVASVFGLFAIGTKYAVVLGIVEGVTNMIPYFGAIVGSIAVAVIVLFTDGVGKAVVVGIFLFVLQQIDGNIIKPKLFGDSFNISPFIVIFSITLGGSYYGVLGMVIAIPVVAVLKCILFDFMDYRIAKRRVDEVNG